MKMALMGVVVVTMGLSMAHAYQEHVPATEADVIAKAKTIEMYCGSDLTGEKFTYSFNYSYESSSDPKHTETYFIATCIAGAYNESSVLFHDDSFDGLQVVPLASPAVNAKGKVVGMTASVVVGSLSYDNKKKTLHTYSKGRGIGDMFSAGTYALSEEGVILRKYELDQTADEKVNAKVVYESKVPLK